MPSQYTLFMIAHTANTKWCPDVALFLAHRLQRWKTFTWTFVYSKCCKIVQFLVNISIVLVVHFSIALREYFDKIGILIILK